MVSVLKLQIDPENPSMVVTMDRRTEVEVMGKYCGVETFSCVAGEWAFFEEAVPYFANSSEDDLLVFSDEDKLWRITARRLGTGNE